MVKKYFLFAERLALSFLHPMEVVTLTSKGEDIINEREGISVHVADDTVPVGRILHLELGSSMHGRLSFPTNVSPVSPILWICPQEDIDLQKAIKITLPHTVKYEESTTELVFMKARHETPLIMPTIMECKFEFEEIVHHEGVEFNERIGSISTRQFCQHKRSPNRQPKDIYYSEHNHGIATPQDFPLTTVLCTRYQHA